MNESDIKELVYHDEYEEIQKNNLCNSKLKKLEKDLEYRKTYFSEGFEKYNTSELNKLKRAYSIELFKAESLDFIYNLLNHLPFNLDLFADYIVNIEISAKVKKELLQKFKQDLAYSIYLGEISQTEALSRGFSISEVNRMKRKCLRERELEYDAYLSSFNLDKDL